MTYCDGCGTDAATGDHARCRQRRAATDPPRFCTECGRKLVVQVLPTGYRAHCVIAEHRVGTGEAGRPAKGHDV